MRHQNRLIKLALSSFILAFLFLPLISVLAATSSSATLTSPSAGATVIGQNTPPAELPNPLGETEVSAVIAKVITFILGIVGSISLLMFIYGGLTWMTSAGASEKIKKGRDIIVWSVIGLAVVFSSYMLARFVIESLSK